MTGKKRENNSKTKRQPQDNKRMRHWRNTHIIVVVAWFLWANIWCIRLQKKKKRKTKWRVTLELSYCFQERESTLTSFSCTSSSSLLLLLCNKRKIQHSSLSLKQRDSQSPSSLLDFLDVCLKQVSVSSWCLIFPLDILMPSSVVLLFKWKNTHYSRQ